MIRKSNRGKEKSTILIVFKGIHIIRLLPLLTCNGGRPSNFDNPISVYIPTLSCKMHKKEKNRITIGRCSLK